MIKNDLLERAYHFEEKAPNPAIITAVCVTFTLSITAFAFILFLFVFSPDNSIPLSGKVTSIVLISTVFAYLILKFIMTLVFCIDKKNSIKLKMLESKCVPVCFCKEAMKTWQIILIYMTPLVLTHGGLILAGVLISGSSFLVVLFIMEFFMSLDWALVIYVIYIKIKYNPDYIAVNHHVYDLTLYSKTYIKKRAHKFINAN